MHNNNFLKSIFSFCLSFLSLCLPTTHTHTQTCTRTQTGNEVGNAVQLSLKYNTITTDYCAIASTWFTESGTTTLTASVVGTFLFTAISTATSVFSALYYNIF